MDKAHFIQAIVEQVQAHAKACSRPHDELLKVHAVAQALTLAGVPSRPTLTDISFRDDDLEGLRVYAFTVDDTPCGLSGTMGWERLCTEEVSSSRFALRPWACDEGLGAIASMADEIQWWEGDVDQDFQSTVDAWAGLALAAVHAQQLQASTPQGPCHTRRPGL